MIVDKLKAFGIGMVVVMVIVLIVAAIYLWSPSGRIAAPASGELSQAQLNSINPYEPGNNVSVEGSTIYVNGSSTVPVLMGPMNTSSMYSFEIFGIMNPTIRVQEDSRLNFVAINIDNDSEHNFVLTSASPPYYYMSGMGGRMMYGYGNDTGYLSMMQYIQPHTSGPYFYGNLSYSFDSPGTYWYLCTYPGHAENGMYGKIVVT